MTLEPAYMPRTSNSHFSTSLFNRDRQPSISDHELERPKQTNKSNKQTNKKTQLNKQTNKKTVYAKENKILIEILKGILIPPTKQTDDSQKECSENNKQFSGIKNLVVVMNYSIEGWENEVEELSQEVKQKEEVKSIPRKFSQTRGPGCLL